MTTETKPRKVDVQKLQRAIVNGLEDVKGNDIRVFNTEHLSPLFERVVIASGTSNRQTKALASSVSDAVKDAGFPKPRVEGEENGEWIIVDCGQAVVHVMQPTIRAYYNLEEIWGGKAVRLKSSVPAKPATAATESKPVTRKVTAAGASGVAKPSRSRTLSTTAPKARASEGQAPAVRKTSAAPSSKTPRQTVVVGAPTRRAAKSTTASSKTTASRSATPRRKPAA